MIFARLVAAAAAAVFMAAGSANAGGFVCGNSIVGPNEQCDDGNTRNGDGCDEFCAVENAYECTGSFVPTDNNVVADPGFEDGGGAWISDSSTPGPVVCNVGDCPEGFFSRDGAWWSRFGSVEETDQSILIQEVTIPTSHRYFEFDLALPVCGSPNDELLVLMDGQRIARFHGADPDCGTQSYRREVVDLEGATGQVFNDGGGHELVFQSTTRLQGNLPTVFLVDNVAIVEQVGDAIPSVCELADLVLDYEDFDPGVAGDLGALGLTTFELAAPVPWGTTDDGVCGTGQLPLGNVTGGAGEAACLDATAADGEIIVSLFCQGPTDLSTVLGTQLSFLLNVQLGQQTPNDFFAVLVGTVPPDEASIGSYGTVYQAPGNVGEFGAPPGEEITVSLNDFDGAPEVWACFVFGSETAFYAQVDSTNISAQDCTDDLDEDKLLGCFDNCSEKFNPDQTDSDGDGYGNACDPDINRLSLPMRVPSATFNDCVVNVSDLGVLRQAFFSTPMDSHWNPDADFNNDGVVNIEDLGVMRQAFFTAPGPSSQTSICQAPLP